MEKRRIYSDFLKNIKILEDMNDYERQTLADALQPKTFKEGDQIVKQGDDGYSFFIITSKTNPRIFFFRLISNTSFLFF